MTIHGTLLRPWPIASLLALAAVALLRLASLGQVGADRQHGKPLRRHRLGDGPQR